MSKSGATTTELHFTLTVRPGFAHYQEPISNYVKCENFGSDMTVYTFDNEKMALFAKKRLESEGYIIHMQLINGTTLSTTHDVIYTGIKISGSQ